MRSRQKLEMILSATLTMLDNFENAWQGQNHLTHQLADSSRSLSCFILSVCAEPGCPTCHTTPVLQATLICSKELPCSTDLSSWFVSPVPQHPSAGGTVDLRMSNMPSWHTSVATLHCVHDRTNCRHIMTAKSGLWQRQTPGWIQLKMCKQGREGQDRRG